MTLNCLDEGGDDDPDRDECTDQYAGSGKAGREAVETKAEKRQRLHDMRGEEMRDAQIPACPRPAEKRQSAEIRPDAADPMAGAADLAAAERKGGKERGDAAKQCMAAGFTSVTAALAVLGRAIATAATSASGSVSSS